MSKKTESTSSLWAVKVNHTQKGWYEYLKIFKVCLKVSIDWDIMERQGYYKVCVK